MRKNWENQNDHSKVQLQKGCLFLEDRDRQTRPCWARDSSVSAACYTFRSQDVYVLTGDLKAPSKSEGGFCLNLDAVFSLIPWQSTFHFAQVSKWLSHFRSFMDCDHEPKPVSFSVVGTKIIMLIDQTTGLWFKNCQRHKSCCEENQENKSSWN